MVERLTIPDVIVDKKTTRRTIIDGSEVRKHAMEFYWRLKLVEDILGDDYDLDRLRELVEADRDGRCVMLPVLPDLRPGCRSIIAAVQKITDMKKEEILCLINDDLFVVGCG